jgi:hypothetical protein
MLGLLLGVMISPPMAHGQLGGSLSEFGFLRLDASARSAALGSSLTAAPSTDATAFYYNPALSRQASSGQLAASYTNFIADSQVGSLAYSYHIDGTATVSAGVRYVDWGSFDGRDAQGLPTGDFAARDVALTVGLATALSERIRYGANVHLVYSAIESARATAAAVDAGIQVHWPERRWSVAASVHHLGRTLSDYGTASTSLPVDWRVGVAKELDYLPLQVSVTGYDLHNFGTVLDDEPPLGQALAHLTLGLELALGEVLSVRGGYNHRRSRELVLNDRLDWAGFGTGFGIDLGPLRADYAFTSWSSFGGLHQVSLQVGP